jgi:hypothetical protein
MEAIEQALRTLAEFNKAFAEMLLDDVVRSVPDRPTRYILSFITPIHS